MASSLAHTRHNEIHIRFIYVQASLDGPVRGAPVGQRDVEPNAEEERKARYVVRVYR
jgi:hypothetical protein